MFLVNFTPVLIAFLLFLIQYETVKKMIKLPPAPILQTAFSFPRKSSCLKQCLV